MIENMVRKGQMEEISSKILFSDESRRYRIFCQDFEKIRDAQLPKFLIQSNNFQIISVNRIKKMKKVIRFYLKRMAWLVNSIGNS